MPIKITGIHHANVHLDDAEKCRDFYGRLLGLSPDPRMPFKADTPNFFWEVGDQGTQIHSPCFSTPDPEPDHPIQLNSNHVSLMVEDIEEAKRCFEGDGIAYREVPVPGRATLIFVNDPSGNMLEFFQPPVWRDDV